MQSCFLLLVAGSLLCCISAADVDCSTLFPKLSLKQVGKTRSKRGKPATVGFDPRKGRWDVDVLQDPSGLEARLVRQSLMVMGSVPAQYLISGEQFVDEMSNGARVMTWDSGMLEGWDGPGLAQVPAELSKSWPLDWKMHLAVGGRHSGAQWHQHGPSFLVLLRGKKRWFLHEQGRFPRTNSSALHLGIADWEVDALPREESKPAICVQHAGETLFVPDLWAHATINLGDVVGVAVQVDNPLGVTQDERCTLDSEDPDHFCLHRLFNRMHLEDLDLRPSAYERLFRLAQARTIGEPYCFIKYLSAYAEVDKRAAMHIFDAHAGQVLERLQATAQDSKEAGMLATIAEKFAHAGKSVKEASAMALAIASEAFRKFPRSGIGQTLVLLLHDAKRPGELVKAAERHLKYFPKTTMVETLMRQAKEGLKRSGKAARSKQGQGPTRVEL